MQLFSSVAANVQQANIYALVCLHVYGRARLSWLLRLHIMSIVPCTQCMHELNCLQAKDCMQIASNVALPLQSKHSRQITSVYLQHIKTAALAPTHHDTILMEFDMSMIRADEDSPWCNAASTRCLMTGSCLEPVSSSSVSMTVSRGNAWAKLRAGSA